MRRALRRRLFERTMRRALPDNADARVEHLGTPDGGWLVPADTIDSDWICYCAGTGKDISFDLDLIRRYGCDVYAFEPAPEAVAYVESAAAGEGRFHFRPVALAASDGPLRMYRAGDPAHVSLSAANVQITRDHIEVAGRSMQSLMRELGHERIDLLKADLEGAEYTVLSPEELVRAGVRVLCFDVHPSARASVALRFLDSFTAAGFRLAGRNGMKLTLTRLK